MPDTLPQAVPAFSAAVTDGAEAIRALNRRLRERDGDDFRASPEDLAAAVLSTIGEAEVEEVHLYALTLDTVDRERAVFSAPGGMSMTLHRGDWQDRGRPSHIWVTIQTALYAP